MNTAKHHTTIKIKAIDIKSSTYISFGASNDSYLNLKLMTISEYHIKKTFLQKFTL